MKEPKKEEVVEVDAEEQEDTCEDAGAPIDLGDIEM